MAQKSGGVSDPLAGGVARTDVPAKTTHLDEAGGAQVDGVKPSRPVQLENAPALLLQARRLLEGQPSDEHVISSMGTDDLTGGRISREEQFARATPKQRQQMLEAAKARSADLERQVNARVEELQKRWEASGPRSRQKVLDAYREAYEADLPKGDPVRTMLDSTGRREETIDDVVRELRRIKDSSLRPDEKKTERAKLFARLREQLGGRDFHDLMVAQRDEIKATQAALVDQGEQLRLLEQTEQVLAPPRVGQESLVSLVTSWSVMDRLAAFYSANFSDPQEVVLQNMVARQMKQQHEDDKRVADEEKAKTKKAGIRLSLRLVRDVLDHWLHRLEPKPNPKE